jgi:hypothetical protein
MTFETKVISSTLFITTIPKGGMWYNSSQRDPHPKEMARAVLCDALTTLLGMFTNLLVGSVAWHRTLGSNRDHAIRGWEDSRSIALKNCFDIIIPSAKGNDLCTKTNSAELCTTQPRFFVPTRKR